MGNYSRKNLIFLSQPQPQGVKRRTAYVNFLPWLQLFVIYPMIKYKKERCGWQRTKAFDTNEVLHKAMSVFGSRGYEGTTLPDLINGLGIENSIRKDVLGEMQNPTDGLESVRSFWKDWI